MTGPDLRVTDPLPPKLHAAVGEVIADTYEIRGVLGSGGMGIVYDAWDRRLRRAVAVKVPLGEWAADRLVSEATALAAIRHPSVLGVYALGEHGGLPFLVTERIFGQSLQDHLDRRRQLGAAYALAEAVGVVAGLLEAVVEVHRAGIAHRDIKPGNVMITGRRVVLMDLGLVIAEYDSAPEGQIVGSPEYIAPEMITGSVAPGAAHLIDVYEVGAVLFELLTGETMFARDSLPALLLATVNERAPDVRSLRPEVPRVLAELIAASLSKDPTERPDGAEAMLSALRSIERGLEAKPIPTPAVLVVDDEPATLVMLERWLAEWLPGSRVVAAPSGDAALAELAKARFELVLMDLGMPGMTGFELAMFLLDGREGVTVAAVTANVNVEDRRVLAELGVHSVFQKGATLRKDLAAFVHRWRKSR